MIVGGMWLCRCAYSLIETLNINNLRGLEETSLSLGPSVNLWTGDNGAGKTSILEAVSILSAGRSFVTARTKSIVRFGADALTIFGRVRQNDQSHGLALQVSRSNDRRLRFDGMRAQGQAVLGRVLPVLVLAPQMPGLVVGPPSDRRSFLDWGAFHWSGGSSREFSFLARALSQRNAGLRSGILREDEVDVWDHQIAKLGEVVNGWRQEFVDAVIPRFYELINLLGVDIDLRLEYKKGWGGSCLYQALNDGRARDLRSRTSHVGPHRADFELHRGELKAADTLSRGQLKIISLALVFAQLEVVKARGRSPVLCFDDPGAELDAANLGLVWDVVLGLNCQVLATGITESRIGLNLGKVRDFRVFHVKHGQVG